MPEYDLTEAVEAATRAAHADCGCYVEGQPLPKWLLLDTHETIIAALPHIERQVREQVARKIEAECSQVLTDDDAGRIESVALTLAARIARGNS